ncbi:hypothetical protein [Saccharospirillum mangrovi]|uniref:hypothetical protein n=1 Tax=Saccharospirillum mangrovi TaxID=2161747 RepID=UPI001E551DFD|nr:hypothetical protein [Saccharospirillum mangrovi]
MNNPKQSLVWMGLYLAIVLGVCALIYAPLSRAFMANWVFNGLILAVLLAGIAMSYRQVIRLLPEMQWVARFRTGRGNAFGNVTPKLLMPLARQLGDDLQHERVTLTAMSLTTLLDGIRSRLDEARELSRYMIGLLVFLGLLGTFWGLLGTIDAIGRVILDLNLGDRPFNEVFRDLQAGLLEPLNGMGTAFSSSLFGLGGSLVLGFLDIQAGHAQNRFFNSLEEWLIGLTQLVEINTDGTEILTDALTPEELAEQIRRLDAENRQLKRQLGFVDEP